MGYENNPYTGLTKEEREHFDKENEDEHFKRLEQQKSCSQMQKRDYIRKKLHNVQKINRENAPGPYGQRTSSFPGTLVATAQACGMTVGHSAPAPGGNLDAGSVAGSRSAAGFLTPSLDVACHALAHQLHRE